MTPLTYASDPIVWAQKKRNQWAFLLFLPLPVFGCLLFSPLALEPNSRITAAAAFIFFLIAIWSLRRNQQTTTFDPVREPHVRIAEDHLEYFRETTTTTITFNDLKRLVIRQNLEGEIHKIELQTARQKVELMGLQNMKQLLEVLIKQLPTTCRLRYARSWFYTYQPGPWLLFAILYILLLFWWQENVLLSTEPAATVLGLYFLFQIIKNESNFLVQVGWGFLVLYLGTAQIIDQTDGQIAAALWQQPCSITQRIIRPGLCQRAVAEAEHLYFYGADDNLTKLDWSRIALFPTNNWIGFWTPVLSHDRSVDYFLPSVDRHALVSTTTTARGTTFWVWQSERDVPFGPFAFSDLISKRAVSLAPGGNQIAIADDEGTHLLDVATGQGINLTDKNLAPLTFDVDGQYLFGINENEQPVMWNILEQIEVTVFPLPDDFEAFGAQAITLSADGRWLAVVYRRSVAVWDVQAVRIWRQFPIPGAAELVFADVIALTPDGDYLATSVSHLDGEDNYLFLWHMESSDLFATLYLGPTSSSFAQTLDISADGELLAVGTRSSGYVLAVDKLLEK